MLYKSKKSIDKQIPCFGVKVHIVLYIVLYRESSYFQHLEKSGPILTKAFVHDLWTRSFVFVYIFALAIEGKIWPNIKNSLQYFNDYSL